jgi:hypothetical protein
MSYLSWRITYQNAEQAAQAAYAGWAQAQQKIRHLEASIEDMRSEHQRELREAVRDDSEEDLSSLIP